MPYDPNFPPANAELTSPAFREQFQGLAALIAAVPAGPQGEQGPPGNDGAQGPPFAQAVVDGVSTVNPWDPATVGVSFDGTNVHFTFGIPRGNDGSNGADGTGVSGAVIDGVTSLDPNQGATANVNFDTGGQILHFSFGIPRGQTGDPGPPGPQGPAFGNAVVDSVSTLDPGQPANVQSWFDGSTVHFTFAIPRGNDGSNGTNGADGQQGAQGPPFASAVVDAVNTLNPGESATVQSSFDGTNVHLTFGIPRGNDGGQGPQGDQGIQGPPGEVTNNDLNNAISGTSASSNGVATLDSPMADPDDEALRQKMNELILALRR